MTTDRRGRRSAALFGSAAVLAVSVVGATAVPARAGASGTPTAFHYSGQPSIGVLFTSIRASRHTCTASVITSPGGDLLLTAAHCVRGTADGYVFVPRYYDGQEPYGAWKVIAAFAPSEWIHGNDPADDVAFLLVASQWRDGVLRSIQSVTGSHALGTEPPSGHAVWVPAYASGSGDQPFTCGAAVYYDGAYPGFNCYSYPDGTSGAPWLLDTPRGREVVGVIGGLHQGGCNVVTSYSSGFGSQVWAAYDHALTDRDSDTLPAPGSDGC